MWVFGYEYSQIIKGNLGTNEVGKWSTRKFDYEYSRRITGEVLEKGGYI